MQVENRMDIGVRVEALTASKRFARFEETRAFRMNERLRGLAEKGQCPNGIFWSRSVGVPPISARDG